MLSEKVEYRYRYKGCETAEKDIAYLVVKDREYPMSKISQDMLKDLRICVYEIRSVFFDTVFPAS